MEFGLWCILVCLFGFDLILRERGVWVLMVWKLCTVGFALFLVYLLNTLRGLGFGLGFCN